MARLNDEDLRSVLITGGTGYLGRRLAAALVARDHKVRILTRLQSLERVADGAEAVVGYALDPACLATALRPGDVLVHLVGTPHPGPKKAAEFQRVDLPSVRAAVEAASKVGIAHLVYVSVAHPAPVMQAYIDVRCAGEQRIAEAGLTAIVLRPWYVLGPGHWWPLVLVPGYALASLVPAWRPGARRLGLVSLPRMIDALVSAVEARPAPRTLSVLDVPAIRAARRS